MVEAVTISIVIPTFNRPDSLERVLSSVQKFDYPIREVIIVDASDHPFTASQLKRFNLKARIIVSRPSVCVQRNIGINAAKSEWILLCDDDLEFPPNYVRKIIEHAKLHPNAGAITGLVLQKDNVTGKWTGEYPVHSSIRLIYRYVFGLSLWGPIHVSQNIFTKAIVRSYARKGNSVSQAGWPILTDLTGEFFKTPFYGLGACMIKRAWLTNSPFDECLDANGYGDNFGVAAGFPAQGIHVLNNAAVYHYRDELNRPDTSIQFQRRLFALHYFIVEKLDGRANLAAFLWSVIGLLIAFLLKRRVRMILACMRVIVNVVGGSNPYIKVKPGHKTS